MKVDGIIQVISDVNGAVNSVVWGVPILILIMVAVMFPLSGLSGDYLIREMIQRISRNLFLIMSLFY